MKKEHMKRFVALCCAFVLCFCDTGTVLAQNDVTLPVAEENQDVTEQPDDETTETPDDGTTEEPEQPEHTHVYVETITKEPTYTEKGEKTFTCECGDTYTEEINVLALETPKFSGVENTTKGIKVYWNEVEGATSYKIFRKNKNDVDAQLQELAILDGTTLEYEDISVESGVMYIYVIKAYNDASESGYSEEFLRMFLTQPTLTGEVTEEGILLSWNAVSGVEYYDVQKLGTDGIWHQLIATEETSVIDDVVEYGSTYTYRVVAIKSGDENTDTFKSAYSEELVISLEKLAAPTSFKVVNNGYTQLKLTWESVMGAEGYQIYRSKTNKTGSFIKVATVTGEKYINKNLTTDTKYYYKIRSYAGDEVSDFTEVKSATPKVLTPKMKKTANAAGNYVKVSWTKPAGAHGYYVYRKQGADGTWKRIGTVKDPDTTSYKDTTATGRYYYAVRAYKKVNGKTYTSLRANSIQASVLKKAKVSSVKQKGSERAVTVTWEKVNNATGYQVYKKIGKNGSWKLAKTTGKDARSYSSEIPQGTYTYWKVRAIRKINDVTTYALFSDSKSFIFATPKFSYELSTNYGNSVKTIKLTIQNTAKASLRFYTEDAMLIDEYDDSNNRYLYVSNADGDVFNYSDVKAGKTKTITFRVDGKATGYYDDSIFNVVFRYDGLKYLFLTYADGSYYELYLLE